MTSPPDPMTLAQALHAARERLDEALPPDALKARVLDAATAAASTRQPARAAAPRGPQPDASRPRGAVTRLRRGAWWAWSGAAACASVLAGSALLMMRLPPPGNAEDGLRMAGFVSIVPPERWPTESAAPAWLVRAELPGERLAALGLPYDPARAGERVPAELLLHPSGEVLAVRLVH